MRSRPFRLGCLLLLGWPSPLSADPGRLDEPDAATVQATSETTVRLFRRALLPGANGALVELETQAPAYEYLSVNARDIDAFGELDALEVEFWGWVSLGVLPGENAFDADVGSANATQHFGSGWVRLGRQLVAGGAARYARFDGVNAGHRWGSGSSHHGRVESYAGFSVLPRWDGVVGYHQLGSLQESGLRDPALALPSRADYLLGGARASYGYGRIVDGSLSFHEEQQADELGRRNLGAQLHLAPKERIDGNVELILDLDSLGVADARSWIDWMARDDLDATVEFLHVQPDLFLSRQSVLSAFSTESFREVGATLGYRPVRHIEITPYGYLEAFPEREYGARGGVRLAVDVDAQRRTRLVLGYGRVVLQETGYHSLQNSLSHRLAVPLTLFLDARHYAYDRPIEGHPGSTVYSVSCAWQFASGGDLLWGASLANTPYAARDLQTLVRVRVSEGWP